MAGSHQESTGKRLTRNSLFNALGFAWQGVVILLLIPYIIHRIGIERYGVWALLVAVVSYFALIDVSGNSTLTRYVAEYHSKRDTASLAALVDNSALFYFAMVLFVLLSGTLLTNPILHLLNIPPHLYNEAAFVFRYVLVIFCLDIFTNVFTSVVNGLQRMDMYNAATMTANTLKAMGTVFVLQKGWGLRGIVISDVVVEACSLLLMMLCAKLAYPPLRINPLRYDRDMMARIVRFGAKLQVSGLSELVNFQLDKILLSRFLGVQYVAFYDVGARLLNYVRGFLLMVVSALTPAIAELDAHGQREKIVALYHATSKYLVTLGLLALGFCFVAAHDIIGLWVGAGYGRSVVTMRILCIGYFLNLVTGIAFYLSVGLGKPEYAFRTAIIQVVGNAVFSVSLILLCGFNGAAIGTTAALTLGGLYFIGSFGKEVGDSLQAFCKTVLWRPLLAAVSAGSLALAINYGVEKFALHPDGRLIRLPLIGLNLLLYTAFYYLILKNIHYFRRQDWQMIHSNLPRRLQRLLVSGT